MTNSVSASNNNIVVADYFDEEINQSIPGAGFVEILQNVVISLAILVVLYLFVITPNEVNGPSMRETLQNKDLLITNKLIQVFGGDGSVFGNYHKNDIVTFHAVKENQDLIKRIIAEPGDRIKIESGEVYVNDVKLDEGYLADGTYENPETDAGNGGGGRIFNKSNTRALGNWFPEGTSITIPKNQFFVMGDNRNNSKDSRHNDIQLINRNDMKGKVLIRIFPLNKFGFVN